MGMDVRSGRPFWIVGVWIWCMYVGNKVVVGDVDMAGVWRIGVVGGRRSG